MLILPDNDVIGAVAILRRILESSEWDEFSSALLALTFLSLAEDLGLPRDAPDRAVWLACQSVGAVFLTANRSGGEHSLERTIDELWDAASLPGHHARRSKTDPQGGRLCDDGRCDSSIS